MGCSIVDMLLGEERVVYRDLETKDLFIVIDDKLYNLYKGNLIARPHVGKEYNHPFKKLYKYPKNQSLNEVNLNDWGKEVYKRILDIKKKGGEVPALLLEELEYLTDKIKHRDKDNTECINKYTMLIKDELSEA